VREVFYARRKCEHKLDIIAAKFVRGNLWVFDLLRAAFDCGSFAGTGNFAGEF
jgi:hypothetical protein